MLTNNSWFVIRIIIIFKTRSRFLTWDNRFSKCSNLNNSTYIQHEYFIIGYFLNPSQKLNIQKSSMWVEFKSNKKVLFSHKQIFSHSFRWYVINYFLDFYVWFLNFNLYQTSKVSEWVHGVSPSNRFTRLSEKKMYGTVYVSKNHNTPFRKR